MVAIISAMQKDGLPVIVTPEAPEPKTGNKHIILTSWASVATALLVVMLIGSAFYTADLKSRECTKAVQTGSSGNTKDYSRTYDNDGDKTKEDFHLDEDDQTELIIKKSEDGNIQMITAVDYKRKISATYIPSADRCMLLAGVDMDWINSWDNAEKEKTLDVLEDEVEEKDYMISGNKVTDLSILPKEMKPYCQGKPTYWMQPADETALEDSRQKRALCYRYCYYRFLFCTTTHCYYRRTCITWCP